MDKYRRIAECSDARHQAEAMVVAESVRMDFAKLITMLDSQLTIASSIDGPVRSHMLEAKAAAQRGIDLSSELIGLLCTAEMKS